MVCRGAIQDIEVCLPAQVLTNEDLDREHPEWNISSAADRSGVRQRHVVSDGETALDLAETACRTLLQRHIGLPDELDSLLFCTQSPDYLLPPNSCVLHGRLGLPERVAAFDMSHACSGFVYSLAIADSMIRAGFAKHMLVVTADTYSRYVHPGDRATRILFGDGAAATWVAADAERGVLEVLCRTAGKGFEKFHIPAGGCRTPRSPETRLEQVDASGNRRSLEHIHMSGRDILGFVNSKIPNHVRELLGRQQLTVDQVDWFVFHQASATALDSLARLLRIDDVRMVRHLEQVGNTVSASIPMAVRHGVDTGQIRPGSRGVICGFGAGLSWASALVQW